VIVVALAETFQAGLKRFVLRSDAVGCAAGVFKALGVALPPLVRQLPAATPLPKPAAPPETPRAA
jgi:hypothetical protein